jgi:hypothetical protein
MLIYFEYITSLKKKYNYYCKNYIYKRGWGWVIKEFIIFSINQIEKYIK